MIELCFSEENEDIDRPKKRKSYDEQYFQAENFIKWMTLVCIWGQHADNEKEKNFKTHGVCNEIGRNFIDNSLAVTKKRNLLKDWKFQFLLQSVRRCQGHMRKLLFRYK